MPKEVPLPPAFAWLEGQVAYVQRVSSTEYSSSCPKCGGAIHPNGEWPDRLRIFDDDHKLVWCRRCGHLQFADQAEAGRIISREEFDRWRREQIRREEERKRSAERALAHLRNEQIWLRYHEALDTYYRGLWHRRGVPDHWIDFWQLGCRREWSFRQNDGALHRTASLSIPLFDHDWNCLNIKHRLLDPPPDRRNMRYLYEVRDQAEHPLFLCDPSAPLAGHVYAIEGEIKSMVTFLRLDDAHTVMVGLPGEKPGPDAVRQLANAERVTLVFDPGGTKAMLQFARQLGIKRCWYLPLAEKIDDGILAADMEPYEVRWLLRSALRLSDYVIPEGR